jgi:hypothetical protein
VPVRSLLQERASGIGELQRFDIFRRTASEVVKNNSDTAENKTLKAPTRSRIRPGGFWGVLLAWKSQGVIASCTTQQMPEKFAIFAMETFNHR